jgi:hypothetical protein
MILDDTSTLIFKLYNIVYNHVYIGKRGDLVTNRGLYYPSSEAF